MSRRPPVATVPGDGCRTEAGHARSRKRAVRLMQEIVRDIIACDQRAGAKLPAEADLLREYAVSRSTLREALRLLEVQGLIRIRPGPGSGTEVGAVEAGFLAQTLALYLSMDRTTLGDLLSAWRIVEPMLAGLAARHPDRARVAALMQPFVADDRHAPAHGLAFHDAVAALAGNAVLALLFGAIGLLVTEQVKLSRRQFRLSAATIHAHHAIARAIVAGDEGAAVAAMTDHLDAVIAEIAPYLPDRGAIRLVDHRETGEETG